ncbi:MAG: signal peptidase I [Spirochaetales bacterium]|nr:signal peptidase I [Spirochaetales bacterium]
MNNILTATINRVKANQDNFSWLVPFFVLVVWTIVVFITIFTTGFHPFDLWLVASIIFRLSIIASNLYFLWNLFILENRHLYHTLKTYTGYCILAVYIGFSLPRLSWEMNGLITESRAFMLWVFSSISSLLPLILYFLLWKKKTRLSWGIITEEEAREKKTKFKVQRSMKQMVIENVHVFIQAIIIVILIQHFVFQLYLIPSESMVPSILVNDRALVTKFLSGPSIPLTDWRFPAIQKPHRGSIVVFESPDYKQTSLLKKIFQHFVFLATLSLVDIDLDENHQVRKRFIVKRVIGEPGEKLMMLDDKVYIKIRGESDFIPIDSVDRMGPYAHTDLYDEIKEIRKEIKYIPVTRETREILTAWDNKKKLLSIDILEKDIAYLVDTIQTIRSNGGRELFEYFTMCLEEVRVFNTANPVSRLDVFHGSEIEHFEECEVRSEYHVYKKYFSPDNKEINYSHEPLSPYSLNGKKLSLLFQKLCLEKFKRYLELIVENTLIAAIWEDAALVAILEELNDFYIYIRYYDERNFPEFPAAESQYIPEDHYFLMGDNRYHSYDFRFSAQNEKPTRIDKTDPHSFVYYSMLNPHLLEEKKILGLVVARLWPFSRFGTID